jgi:hypothetical protein
MTKRDLGRTQVGADCGKIASKPARMLHAVLAQLLNNRVFRLSAANRSSSYRHTANFAAVARGQSRASPVVGRLACFPHNTYTSVGAWQAADKMIDASAAAVKGEL